MSTALDNSGHNCNVALQAESLVMAKEHVVKAYGTLRYTIGTGCSGGSLAQQWIANAYPGIYQGILPTCSFPDAWSTATQFLDYHLLLAYFTQSVEMGTRGRVAADTDGRRARRPRRRPERRGVRQRAVPRRRPDRPVRRHDQRRPLQPDRRTRAACAARSQDAAINVFGPEPQALWTVGRDGSWAAGSCGLPVDNVGVEYGLEALKAAQITPAQFVDLNANIGGPDIDANPTPHGSMRPARLARPRVPQRDDQRGQQP